MTLTEDAVRQALESLKVKRLAGPVNSADSRVTKYEHRMQEVFNFSRGENAVLCVLMLRRSADPLENCGDAPSESIAFEDLTSAVSFAEADAARPPAGPAIAAAAWHEGSRYVHLFCGLVEAFVMPEPNPTPRALRMDNAERLEKLEETVGGLQREVKI